LVVLGGFAVYVLGAPLGLLCDPEGPPGSVGERLHPRFEGGWEPSPDAAAAGPREGGPGFRQTWAREWWEGPSTIQSKALGGIQTCSVGSALSSADGEIRAGETSQGVSLRQSRKGSSLPRELVCFVNT